MIICYRKTFVPTDVMFRKVMAQIKAVDDKLQILINSQQSRESREDVEDVLPAPVCSLEELADLCTKVADKTFKKKLVRISSIIYTLCLWILKENYITLK